MQFWPGFPGFQRDAEQEDDCDSESTSSFTSALSQDATFPASSAGRGFDVVLDGLESDWVEVPEVRSIPLSEHEASGSEASKDEVFTLDAAEDNSAAELPTSQWVFFVRHAESRWNKAQARKSIVGMFKEKDHGLSETGRRQAELLRWKLQVAAAYLQELDGQTGGGKKFVRGQSEQGPDAEHIEGWENLPDRRPPPTTSPEQWLRMLLNPDQVASSPFTRAICTATLGFQDCLRDKSLFLMREAREHKVIGGVDSVGIATGREIPRRVQSDLNDIYKEESNRGAVLEEFRSINVDYSDCYQPWWGGAAGDAKDLMKARTGACLRKLRRVRGRMPGGGGVSILVSHSLFLQTIFKTYLRPGAQPSDIPHEVADAVCSTKLPYAAVIGCKIEWDEENRPSVTEVQPVLGTILRSPKFGATRALDRDFLMPPEASTGTSEEQPKPEVELGAWELM